MPARITYLDVVAKVYSEVAATLLPKGFPPDVVYADDGGRTPGDVVDTLHQA